MFKPVGQLLCNQLKALSKESSLAYRKCTYCF